MNYFDVICECGYPIISKEVSHKIADARRGGKWGTECLNGERKNPYGNATQYKYLLGAPFLISNKCCDKTKKQPFISYRRNSSLYPMVATMAEESALRQTTWMKTGCNAFDGKRPQSKPMSFWLNQDVLHYIQQEDIPICSVYGDIMAYDGGNYYPSTLCDAPLKCTGCQRTGQINAAR